MVTLDAPDFLMSYGLQVNVDAVIECKDSNLFFDRGFCVCSSNSLFNKVIIRLFG